MAKVIILCGKIASGKSYYAEKLSGQTGAVILSVDELMLKLSDSCLGQSHDDVARRCETYFYKLAEQLISKRIDVIIDYGYWSRDERNKAKNYFINRGIEVELHYIVIDEQLRLRQLDKRNEMLLLKQQNALAGREYIIGEELRIRLDNKFQEPTSDEGCINVNMACSKGFI